MSTPLIFALALAALAAILLVYVRTSRPKRKRPKDVDGSKRDPRAVPPRQGGRKGLSAVRTIEVSRSLRKSNAQGPEIISSLNPDGNSQVNAALLALRGPHMFVPQTALNIIEQECGELLRSNPAATQLAGLIRAKESMETVTRFGD